MFNISSIYFLDGIICPAEACPANAAAPNGGPERIFSGIGKRNDRQGTGRMASPTDRGT
jgi:hypothetical protein